jgi:hypothetical protein
MVPDSAPSFQGGAPPFHDGAAPFLVVPLHLGTSSSLLSMVTPLLSILVPLLNAGCQMSGENMEKSSPNDQYFWIVLGLRYEFQLLATKAREHNECAP